MEHREFDDRDPKEPFDLNRAIDLGLLRLCSGGLAKGGFGLLSGNDDVDSLLPPSLVLSCALPSPMVAQLSLLDDRGSHKKLLKTWLQGKAATTELIHDSISGQ